MESAVNISKMRSCPSRHNEATVYALVQIERWDNHLRPYETPSLHIWCWWQSTPVPTACSDSPLHIATCTLSFRLREITKTLGHCNQIFSYLRKQVYSVTVTPDCSWFILYLTTHFKLQIIPARNQTDRWLWEYKDSNWSYNSLQYFRFSRRLVELTRRPDYGGNNYLWNVRKLLSDHTG